VKPGSTTEVHPADLAIYHRNPRKGDLGVIAASLKVHGQYRPIVANIGTYTNRPGEVLAGNHTLMAVRDLLATYPEDERWSHILVHWVDVDEDRAKRIVLADNRTAELGAMDSDALYRLIGGVVDLEGSGYDREYLDMLSELNTGPPSISSDNDVVSDPEPDDPNRLERVRLRLPWELVQKWREYRKPFADDTAAMSAALP